MNNILLTGGAGFIGSNVLGELLNKYNKIKVLDNFSTGKRENLEPYINDIELIEGDVRSYHIVLDAVSKVDVVIHLAALPSVPRSIKDPLTTNEVNVVGTLNLLQACVQSKVKRFIFASSSSVYGDTSEMLKREDMKPNPLSPYAVSKITAENYCKVFSKIYGIHTVVLRYFNVFGPNQDPNSQYSAVIPKFINLVLKNETPVIFGDGTQSRDFTYIKNVVNANLLSIEADCQPGSIFNCACGENISVNKLLSDINIITGKNIKAKYMNSKMGDVKHSLADISSAKKYLNYEPEIKFSEGIKKTINYFVDKK